MSTAARGCTWPLPPSQIAADCSSQRFACFRDISYDIKHCKTIIEHNDVDCADEEGVRRREHPFLGQHPAPQVRELQEAASGFLF